MNTPYLGYSELTKAIYIVYGKRKFNVTDQFADIMDDIIAGEIEEAEELGRQCQAEDATGHSF